MLSRRICFRNVARLRTAFALGAAVGAALLATLLPAASANALSTGTVVTGVGSRALAEHGFKSTPSGFAKFGRRADAHDDHIALSHSSASRHGKLVLSTLGISSRDPHRFVGLWAWDDRHGKSHDRSHSRSRLHRDGIQRIVLALLGGGSRLAEYFKHHPGSSFDFHEWKSGSGGQTEVGGADVVPEPGSALLLGLGMIYLGAFSQRERRSS